MQTKIIDNPVKDQLMGLANLIHIINLSKSKHDFRQLITLMPSAAAL